MTADAIDLLRAHDPARRLPPADAARRDALLASVLATSTPPARRRRIPRPVALAAAVLLGLAFAAAGWAVYRSVFRTAADVRSEFAAAAKALPLPPGAAWKPPALDERALYAGPAGEIYAQLQATCAWLGYWEAGHATGDRAQMSEAARGFAVVRGRMPLHPAAAPEDAGGYDAGTLAAFDRILRDERRGAPQSTEQYLAANCSGR